MSTTGQVRTFGDLYGDLISRIRGHTSSTVLPDQMKKFINIAHQDIHIGAREKIPWAERRSVLLSQAQYSTGTVSIAQGSTTLTGTGTAWNTANSFGVANARTTGKLVLNGGTEVYGITTVGSDTSITLNQRFTQSTLTDATYVYFEDEYALHADFLRPVDFRFFDQYRQLNLLDRAEFRRRFVTSRVAGKPQYCCIMDVAPTASVTPVRRVLFDKPTDEVYSFPYSFITNKLVVDSSGTAKEEFTADADESIMPLSYRHLIVERALFFVYRDWRDDNRMVAAAQSFTDMWLRVMGDQEFGQARATMTARVGGYYSAARRPMRSGSSPGVTSGTAFDEFRD